MLTGYQQKDSEKMAQNLQRNGSIQPTNTLLQALSVEDQLARDKQIAKILDELNEDKAVTLLFDALLKSVNTEPRKRVVEQLTQIGSVRAVELLGSIMTDDFDPEVQSEALEGLRAIGSEKALEVLLSAVRGGNEVLRWQAARALGDFNSDRVVDALIEATDDRFFRADPAILSLAKIGSERAVEHLVKMLLHDIQSGRDMYSYYAMEGLVRLGTDKAVDGILDAWISPVSILRDRLYFHLTQFKPKHLILPLCQRLQNKTLSADIRKGAAEMLGLIGTESEIPLLESVWKDSSGESEQEVGWRALRSAEQISFEELKRKQERERALEETRAFIAHEFRHALTPLNAYVKMLDEALAQPDVSKEKILDLTGRIRKQTDTAFDLVNQYLDYSRPLKPQFAEADINKLLEESLEEFKAEIEKRHVRLQLHFAEDALASVDRRMLAQVFRNLIANALQAMGRGGTLLASTELYEDDILITIRDTGVGLKLDHLSRLFEVGFTTKRGMRGTGIGLALSKRIIEEAHHGSISLVNNSPDQGVSVRISLPKEQTEIRNGRHDLALVNR